MARFRRLFQSEGTLIFLFCFDSAESYFPRLEGLIFLTNIFFNSALGVHSIAGSVCACSATSAQLSPHSQFVSHDMRGFMVACAVTVVGFPSMMYKCQGA